MSLDTPVFFAATILDVIVLGIIGVLVSACIWVATEYVKRKIDRPKPHTPREKLLFEWLPLVLGVLAGLGLFPLALAGVGAGWPDEMRGELISVSILMGLVGGAGARIAHDRARQLLETAWGWLLDRIGGPHADDEE